MSEETFASPPVSYPEGALNVVEALDSLTSGESKQQAYDLLWALHTQTYPIIVAVQGSAQYERLMTADGTFRIVNYRWYHNKTAVSLGVLCARFPQLAEYFTTRSRAYIAYERHSLQYLPESEQDYVERELRTLAGELEESEAYRHATGVSA
jgi:hypothetical protein